MRYLACVLPVGALLTALAPAHAQPSSAYQERCAICHGDQAEGGRGPALRGVVGRRIAATGYPYSAALRAATGTWTAERLDAYLADPAAAFPGTTMALQTPDAAARRAIVADLATLSPLPSPASAPVPASTGAAMAGATLTGSAAFGDWRSDAPGVQRLIRPGDVAPPYASRSSSNSPDVVARPAGAVPRVPPGFSVSLFAQGLQGPRLLRTAPNGDVFVAETAAGRIRVLRARDGATSAAGNTVFATGLRGPFGLAFYPPGPNPRFLYAALNNQIVRFPYQSGDTTARGTAEIVVDELSRSSGGHSTRDLAFSPDGARMLVSVGSASNVAESIGRTPPGGLDAWRAQAAPGAAWGNETARADVLSYAPDGTDFHVFATGLRNCVGLAIQPGTGLPWCAVNERDGLGDDVPPDYVTRVRAGALYGWPWYYIGDHEDPRHRGVRPDLAGTTTEPDVLIQPHSAPLQMAFYTGRQFPPDYRGDAFVALHGSWNRGRRTGYKLVRVHLVDGVPSGAYEDFLTGFVRDDDSVWGRPVGVTTAGDGSLLVSEDGNGTIWRIISTQR